MPGIAGIIQEKEKDYLLSYADSMSQRLVYNSTDIVDKKVLSDAAFCHVHFPNNGNNFALSDDGSEMVLYLGKVYDDEKLRSKLVQRGDTITDNHGPAELFLRCFKRLGRESLCGLNGIYVIVIWDSLEKKLTIINDRHGFRKLYYLHSGNKFFFATEISAMCWNHDFPKSVDEIGLSNFLMFGYLLDDRTLFENIKILPQASVLTYSDNQLSIEKYWDYSFYRDDEPVWLEDYYVDGLYEVIENAIRKRVNGLNKIAIPLSGGLDSRVIAGMLHNIGFPGKVITYSYGNKNSYDVIYGRQIAQKLHYIHHFVPIDMSYIKNYAGEFTRVNDGMITCLNAHMGVGKNFLERIKTYNVITGFLGDVQTGVFTVARGIEGITNDEQIVKILFSKFGDGMDEMELENYLKEDIYRRVKGANYTMFRDCYYRSPSKNKFFKSRYVNLIQRQRRYTQFNIYCYENFTDVCAPFTDNNVVDFNLHTPPALLIGQNIYKKMIVKYFPEVASVPWNRTKLPLNASWLRKGLHWRWERLNRNSLVRKTIGRRYAMMNDNYLNTAEAIRTGSRDFVVEHIRDNPFLAEYFHMDRIHQMLDNHMSGRVNEYGKITALLTLSLWHKLFIEGKV